MTQIVSAFAKGLAFQVSDRLAVPLEAYTPYVVYPPHIFAAGGIHGGFDFSIPGPHGTLRCRLVGLKREAPATQAFFSPQQRPPDPLQ